MDMLLALANRENVSWTSGETVIVSRTFEEDGVEDMMHFAPVCTTQQACVLKRCKTAASQWVRRRLQATLRKCVTLSLPAPSEPR